MRRWPGFGLVLTFFAVASFSTLVHACTRPNVIERVDTTLGGGWWVLIASFAVVRDWARHPHAEATRWSGWLIGGIVTAGLGLLVLPVGDPGHGRLLVGSRVAVSLVTWVVPL